MHRNPALPTWFAAPLLGVACLSLACGSGESQALKDARDTARSAADVTRMTSSSALFFDGPSDSACAGDNHGLALHLGKHLREKLGCGELFATPEGDGELMHLGFPAEGCTFAHRKLTGEIRWSYELGLSAQAVTLDLSGLSVDGDHIPVRAGVSSCDDALHLSFSAAGTVNHGHPFAIRADVLSQDGGGLFPSPVWTVDGDASLVTHRGTDVLAVRGLEFDGGLLPSDGTIHVDTDTGHAIEIGFRDSTGFLRPGEVTVKVDDGKVVHVPVLD